MFQGSGRQQEQAFNAQQLEQIIRRVWVFRMDDRDHRQDAA